MAQIHLSDEDVRILQRLIDDHKRDNPKGGTVYPLDEDRDDHQAPETYIVKTPTGGIPALSAGDTGTGTSGNDEPGSANCIVYTINRTDALPDLRLTGKTVKVFNVSSKDIEENVYIPVMRDKFGHWVTFPSGVSLVRLCLYEQHPGRGIVFQAYQGTWDPDSNGWDYSSGTGTGSNGTLVYCIDWWYSSDGPYPAAGATGLFIKRESTAYGYIYEAVSMDCESPGTCLDAGTGTGSS